MADIPKEMPKVTGFEVPNFDALGEWHTKLRGWCERALVRMHGLEIELDAAASERDKAQEELATTHDSAETLDELVVMLRDVERGIRDLPEVLDRVRPRWE